MHLNKTEIEAVNNRTIKCQKKFMTWSDLTMAIVMIFTKHLWKIFYYYYYCDTNLEDKHNYSRVNLWLVQLYIVYNKKVKTKTFSGKLFK